MERLRQLHGQLQPEPAAAKPNEAKVADAYDYVIVGGGSAGAVLAARLSEDPTVSVLLLEAGGDDAGYFDIATPARFLELQLSSHDWQYKTEMNPHMANRVIFWPRGKVLGGCSSINAMLWVRGNREDYDAWERQGCAGWGFDSLLPYFKRCENSHVPAHDADLRGTSGPIHVSVDANPNVFAQRFLDASVAAGIPLTSDYNGRQQEGVGRMQQNVHQGVRQSTSACYLTAAVRARPNLTIATHAHVLRVVVAGRVATGVEFKRGATKAALQTAGRRYVQATREVILSAGAVGSPFLLLHSGVGPADQLSAHGIPVAVDAPGVGKNLRDHLMVLHMHETHGQEALNESAPISRIVWAVFEYLTRKTGILANTPVPTVAFTRTGVNPELGERPDLQFHYFPLVYTDPKSQPVRAANLHNTDFIKIANERTSGFGVSITPTLLHPHSRGEIRLRSANPLDEPIIDDRSLSDPRDVEVLVRGLRLSRKMAASNALKGKISREILDPTIPYDPSSERYLQEFVRRFAITIYHPVGTCKMGPDTDAMAVVDSNLRVRGVKGLRIVDASVMPTLVSGNTNAPVIAMAERAADLIRGKCA